MGQPTHFTKKLMPKWPCLGSKLSLNLNSLEYLSSSGRKSGGYSGVGITEDWR